MTPIIYLDNNATTRLDERVLESMMPYLTDIYSNSFSSHPFGNIARKAVDLARKQICELIGSSNKQIVYTSGATEAINLAIKGLAFDSPGEKKHIISVQTEHKAVLDTCKYLESIGYEITFLPVEKDGLLNINNLISAIRKDTLLVSIMWVNNETGVIQDIEVLAKVSKDAGAYFMTDATQVVGKLEVNVEKAGIDLLVFSGHKFYAPKGIGVLYFSKRMQSLITPLTHGGGHEFGLRSGTLNVPSIVGLGKAAEIAQIEMNQNAKQIKLLRDKLELELLNCKGSFINGHAEKRLYNVTNICFPNLETDVFIGRMKQIAVSNGSACTSSVIEPSHVLKAMGLNNDEANSSIRFSLGKFNTLDEIKQASFEINSYIAKWNKIPTNS